jgi:hypothetical protein
MSQAYDVPSLNAVPTVIMNKTHRFTRFKARKNVNTANAKMPTEKNGISARMASTYGTIE